MNIGDIKFEEFTELKIPVVLILSTYGQGGPTADASIFH